MSFANFSNPYRNPADVPEDYRKHPNLSKLFKADGTYVRPAEDPITIWAIALLHQEYGVPEFDFNMGFHKFDPYMDQVLPVPEVATLPKETQDSTTTPETPFNYIDIASIDIELGEIREVSEILGANAPSRARQVIHTRDIIISEEVGDG
jgi:hypothetical protein